MLSPDKTALKIVNDMLQHQPMLTTNGRTADVIDKSEARERARDCAKIAVGYIVSVLTEDEHHKSYWQNVFHAIDNN